MVSNIRDNLDQLEFFVVVSACDNHALRDNILISSSLLTTRLNARAHACSPQGPPIRVSTPSMLPLPAPLFQEHGELRVVTVS